MKTGIIVLFVLWGGVCGMLGEYAFRAKPAMNKVERQQETIDSLKQELTVREQEIVKYEIAVEILEEKNSEAAWEFEDVLNHCTE